jgi:hypothetical protein
MKYDLRNITVLLILLVMPFAGISQSFEKQKNITRSFAVSKECNVQISNKYGNIQIVPWEKDSACFSIDVKVSDKKEADAEKMLNAIDIEFTNSPYYIIAKTIFKNSKNQVIEDFSDYVNGIFGIGKDVEINYILNVPGYSALKIDNKFGNIYTTNHTGNIDITLSNGDLKANNLIGSETKIELSFGNGVVNKIVNGKLNIGYSDLEIKEAGKLSIEGRSAKMNITKAERLDLNSRRDKFYIDTAAVITGTSDFSYINVYYLKESIFLKSLYGDINLTEIAGSVKFINLTSDYTDINLFFQRSCSSTIDLSCKKTELSYPSTVTGLTKQLINEKTGEYKVSGSIGTETEVKSPVQITAVSGSIAINIK